MIDPFSGLGLEQLRRRTSAKWRHYPDDVLPMWVAEMDVALAEPITDAVSEALELGDTGYPSGSAYAKAFAGFAADRWDWAVAVERATAVPDLMSGVAEVVRLVTKPGDPVVVTPPVYPPFFSAAHHTGRELVECPLGAAGRLDLDALEATFADLPANRGSAVFLLCSPHNPTGVVHTKPELERVAELATRHGVRVISDEIHAPLVYGGSRFVPYLSLAGSDDAYAIQSASKAWNLAGLKAALAIGGAGTEAEITKLGQSTHHASHIGLIAQAAALNDGREWLDGLLAALARNRAALSDLLAEQVPEIGYGPPQGTFLAWLDCRKLDLGDDPAAAILDRGRVALNSGPTFGTGGAGFARLNFACSPELLAEGVERIAATVRSR